LPLLKSCQIIGVFWGEFTTRYPALHAANVAALPSSQYRLVSDHVQGDCVHRDVSSGWTGDTKGRNPW
jgi:hypothetical protein